MQPGTRVQSERPPHKAGTVIANTRYPGMIRVHWDDDTSSYENPEYVREQ